MVFLFLYSSTLYDFCYCCFYYLIIFLATAAASACHVDANRARRRAVHGADVRQTTERGAEGPEATALARESLSHRSLPDVHAVCVQTRAFLLPGQHFFLPLTTPCSSTWRAFT